MTSVATRILEPQRHVLFRRSEKQDQSATSTATVKEGGKGRPTPTRKDAEAAARERARAGKDKKSAQKLMRQRRAQNNAKVRQGMKSGDTRYLPARDQGPVRAFIRDYLDVRLSFAEFLMPLLLVIMGLQYSGQDRLQSFSNGLWSATIVLTLVDTMWLLHKLNKQIKTRFSGTDVPSWRFYAILRALQFRKLRVPKPRLKLGQSLPKHY